MKRSIKGAAGDIDGAVNRVETVAECSTGDCRGGARHFQIRADSRAGLDDERAAAGRDEVAAERTAGIHDQRLAFANRERSTVNRGSSNWGASRGWHSGAMD